MNKSPDKSLEHDNAYYWCDAQYFHPELNNSLPHDIFIRMRNGAISSGGRLLYYPSKEAAMAAYEVAKYKPESLTTYPFGWKRGSGTETQRQFLPPDLFDKLTGYCFKTYLIRYYYTEEQAMAALEKALEKPKIIARIKSTKVLIKGDKPTADEAIGVTVCRSGGRWVAHANDTAAFYADTFEKAVNDMLSGIPLEYCWNGIWYTTKQHAEAAAMTPEEKINSKTHIGTLRVSLGNFCGVGSTLEEATKDLARQL